MPRKKPNFEEHKERLFKGLQIDKPEEVDLGTYHSNIKIKVYCPKGHTYKYCASQVQRKKNPKDPYKCPYCNNKPDPNSKKGNYTQGIPESFIQQYADKYDLDYEPKKEYYSRNIDSIKFICKKDGYEKEIKSLKYWEKNIKPFSCPLCEDKKNNILSQEELSYRLDNLKNKNLIEKKYEKINSDVNFDNLPKMVHKHLDKWHPVKFINTKNKARFQCKSCGHIKECYPANLEYGKNSCPECDKIKTRNRVIQELFEKCKKTNVYPTEEYPYRDTITPIKFHCNSCGYDFEKIWSRVNSDNPLNCPNCYKSTKRKSQTKVYNWICSVYNGKVINEDRSLGIELDIFIPEKKLAIEYCGLIWHSTKYRKDPKVHVNKLKYCQDRGIRLLTIFEDEWIDKQSICKSRILNCLNKNITRIHGRKCEVKQILNKEALQFCEENHIQGKGHTYESYGLFYEEDLISVMTFSKPSVVKNASNYDWELNRFCTLRGFTVVGGMSKLLKQFRINHKGEKLISFCDLRWGTGNSYEKTGFTNKGETRLNYYYVGRLTKWKRKHRFNYTKQKLLKIHTTPNSSKTEGELAEELGLYRIYDCGSIKYELDL